MNANQGENAGKNVYLDVLRGWAILGVISCHVVIFVTQEKIYAHQDINQNFIYLLGLGRYGVELFFFISGFLLSSIYRNSDTRPDFSKKTFFAKRALRIYPLWIIFGIIGFVEWRYLNFGPWVENSVTSDNMIDILVLSLTFTLFATEKLWSLVPGGWSIQTEMFQYLLFPILRKKHLRLRVTTTLIAIYFICQFSVGRFNDFPVMKNLLEAIMRLNLIPSIFFFLAGMLIAETDISKVDLRSLAAGIVKNKFFVLIFMTSLLLGFFANKLQRNIAEGFFMIFLFAFLAYLMVQNSLTRIVFVKLGQYSYFLYFFHFQLILILSEFPETRSRTPFYGNIYIEFGLTVFVLLAVSVPIATLSMKYIEKPALSLSKYF